MEASAVLAPVLNFFGAFYEPLFLRRAALALMLLAPVSAGAGVLVVNQRLAFFADAVGHSVFLGVALALLLNVAEKPAILLTGVLIGLLVTYLSRHSRLAADTVIGLVFSGAIALGLVIVSRNPGTARGLSRFFLGDVLTLGDGEILALAALALLSFFFFLFFFNHLTLESLSPVLARSRNPLKSRLAPYAFGVFLALVVTVSVWSVGVLLVTALLVAPAAAGRNWALSAAAMFRVAVVISLFSGQAGLYLSTRPEINTAAGATVVLAAVFIFVLSYFSRRRS
ncbi:MAG: metal ABC transporter permease [Candidatus Adiutrix sp.]|jgi:zinc transport system permease protein|nr:metal ABC transporter permease [Candidatus Adiutrix sp.]